MPKIVLFLLTLVSNVLLAQQQPEEQLIMLQQNQSIEAFMRTVTQRSLNVSFQKTLSRNLNIHLVTTNNPEALAKQQAVRFVEPNLPITWRNVPNDPRYDTQWALDTINAEYAWEYTTGGLTQHGDSIVCAVIDGSFYVNHEDLKDNIWHNRAEIPNNNIDDDQNGFIDDYTGWQTVFNTDKHDYGNLSNHGTSVLGIIGAKGDNNTGVTGINWDIKLMLLSAHTGVEITKLANVIEAYNYILDMRKRYNASNGQEGAFVVSTNASWGIDFAWASNHPIWCALYDSLGAAGILSVAAATNNDLNIDSKGDMPCSCPSDYLIAVSESSPYDQQDGAYGERLVDLFAPAQSKTTRWSDFYGDFGGTSGASPHVAGAIALLYSYQNADWAAMIKQTPVKAALLVKSILLNSVDRKPTFAASVSRGRLNIGRAMQQLVDYFATPSKGELLAMFPSPTSKELTLLAAIKEAGQHPLKIYNTAGQVVALWTLDAEAPGIRRWHFDVEHLARGMYILELETDGQKFTQKFVKY